MRYPARLFAFLVLPMLLVAAFPTAVEPEVTPLQQLFVLKELKPGIQRVGIVWDKNVDHEAAMAQIQRAGTSAGVKVVVGAVADFKELAPMFRDLVRSNQIDALWIVSADRIVDSDLGRKFLIKSATEHGIPILAPSERWVGEGATVALKKEGDGIRLFVNRAAAQAVAVAIPEKYVERTQYLAAN